MNEARLHQLRPRGRVRHGRAIRAWLGLTLVGGLLLGETEPTVPRSITLRECLVLALENNRDLQIERINPEVARATLESSQGLYDPVLLSEVRRESSSDTGGLDPTDFSRDAIYQAESISSRLGLTGVLPTGLSYTLGGTYANSFGLRNGLDFESYSLFAGITVSQPLLRNFWIDQGRLTIQVNRKNLRITELGVRYLAMDVVNRVQQAFVELQLARESGAIQEELLGWRRKTLRGIERKVEQGLSIPAEVLPSQTQLALGEADLWAHRRDVAVAESRLKNLLSEDVLHEPLTELRPVEPLWAMPEPLDLRQSWQRGLEQRPDLAQLREDVGKADLDLKYRRNQLFPSLDLVAGYGRRGASTDQLPPPLEASASLSDAFGQIRDASAPSDMIGVIFSLPLSRATERANHRVSRQLKAQTELRVKQREDLVVQEIAEAMSRARAGLERVDAARRASDFARQALEAEERKLAGGASTLFFVLQLQTDLASACTTEVRALAEYHQARAQLHFAEGSILDRHQLTLIAE